MKTPIRILALLVTAAALASCSIDTRWKVCYEGVCVEGTIPGKPDRPAPVVISSGKEVTNVQ